MSNTPTAVLKPTGESYRLVDCRKDTTGHIVSLTVESLDTHRSMNIPEEYICDWEIREDRHLP